MENVMHLANKVVKFPALSLTDEVLNRRQCENLLSNFQNGVQAFQSITSGYNEVFHNAEEDLYQIVNKARVLVEECCKKDWCRAAVTQMTNKESFRELLLDFENCFHIMCDISHLHHLAQESQIHATRNGTTFYPTSIDEVKADQTSICVRFSKHLNSCKSKDCNDCILVQYLKGYLISLQRVEGGELDKIDFPYNYPRPKFIGDPPKVLGRSSNMCVYLTNWLGLESATKVITICDPKDVNKLWKEASILGGLNHPNIIKFYCCGFHEVGNQFELVMERGTETLSQYLDGKGQLKQAIAMDIMIQIATGMCYLHDMKVAHRDLKPDNVVVTSPNDPTLTKLGCIHVKLLDFGISKVEVKDSPEVPTGQNIGTRGYMAPEAMANNLSEVDALKADVFSFGMMCSKILSGENISFGSIREYRAYIQDSGRPNLPKIYSKELRSIVHDCWLLDPLKRPTFLDIQNRLTNLKSATLKGIGEFTHDTRGSLWKLFLSYLCFAFVTWIRYIWFIPIFRHGNNSNLHPSAGRVSSGSSSNLLSMKVNNANNMKDSLALIGVQGKVFQLERQLQSVGCLGLVGMGGIGKSTLAIVLSDHISEGFDATCFVSDLKDEICTFQVKHKSKDMQTLPRQAKLLTKTREGLEEMQKEKTILIVVDNVIKQNQLQQLLGDGMFNNVNGNKLIVNSRDWNALQNHVPMDGKIDMQTLNKNQAMELMSMHAFGTNQSCQPHLKHVFEKIVDACCGLPLSLKVMGTFIQGETRLRIWERILHRLLRARHDGGLDEKIWKTLRISFDELNDLEKNMFLDIACFFCKDTYFDGIYPTKESYLRMLNVETEIAKKVLERLQEKSLLKVNDWECFYVHDQLRDMGRMIAEHDFPGTRIVNISYPAFVNDSKQKSIELIQGLSITNLAKKTMYNKGVEMQPMAKLCLLIVQFCENIDSLTTIVKKSPNLRWLKIQFAPQHTDYTKVTNHVIGKFFNNTLEDLQNLRYLSLSNCNFFGSHSCEDLNMVLIRELSFSNCENMDTFLNGVGTLTMLEELGFFNCKDLKDSSIQLTNLSALEKIHFSKCHSLRMIPEGIGNLTKLKILRITNCDVLEEFSLGTSKLLTLEELNFASCRALKTIHEGIGNLTNLKILRMFNCEALLKFPHGISKLVALEELNFATCRALKRIPKGFGCLTKLKILRMYNCEALEKFPKGISKLVALEQLHFATCRALKRIPEDFGHLTKLKILRMFECEMLEEFPLGINNLLALEELHFGTCRKLKNIPEGFGSLTKLKILRMYNCVALEEFPHGVSKLVKLEQLNFASCRVLKTIPEDFANLTNLRTLHMCKCEALGSFPHGIENLMSLEKLDFATCRALKTIPKGFESLLKLKILRMYNCEALEEFPHGISKLIALEELNFATCRALKRIPKGFGNLPNFKILRMWECEALEEFPQGVSRLVSLEELNFATCRALKRIPEGFGSLTKLKILCMFECEMLEELPLGVNNLLALEELDFGACRTLKTIPEGFGSLTKLKILRMYNCEALEEFPHGVNKLLALEELNFQGCRALKSIPEGFGGLPKLKILRM